MLVAISSQIGTITLCTAMSMLYLPLTFIRKVPLYHPLPQITQWY